MHFLREIGLGELVENEANFNVVLNYVVENGKLFRGYQGFYIYHHLGYAEFILHVLPTKEVNEMGRFNNVITGFSSHVMGNWFWHLRISERGELRYKNEEDHERDPLEICVFFEDDEERQIPIHLVMADALPSYIPGEFVTLQVAAFTEKINFYADMESFNNSTGVDLPFGRVNFGAGTILNIGIDDSCFVNGLIISVDMLNSWGIDKKIVYFQRVVVKTSCGELPLYFNPDIVDDTERIYIREGAYLSATCVISADVCVDKYQGGAVYDREHCLQVFGDASDNPIRANRMSTVFSKDAIYTSVLGKCRLRGSEAITEHFRKSVQRNVPQTWSTLVRVTGKIEKGVLNRYEHPETALLIAYTSKAFFKQIALVDMDSDGKIKNMLLTDPSEYAVELVKPCYPDLIRNEATCLNVIKKCMDSGDCTPLLDFFTWDVVLNSGNDLRKGIYEVIIYFVLYLMWSRDKEVPLNFYLVRVGEHKNGRTWASGHTALALSASDLEHYEVLFVLHMAKGKIDKINVLRDSGYILETLPLENDICRHDRNTWRENPEQRTEEDWLGYLRSLFDGSEENYFSLFFGITVDCVLEDEVSGKVLNGRMAVTEYIKELVKLNSNRSAEIIMQMDGRMSVHAGGRRYMIETTKEGLISTIRISIA